MITDRLADKAATYSLRNEQSLVNDPRRARRLIVGQLIAFVVVLMLFVFVDGQPVDALVGAYIGAQAWQGVRRTLAYRNGWLDGRMSIISSLSEAQRRDMSLEEWAAAEMSRDFAVMGVEPKHRADDESEQS